MQIKGHNVYPVDVQIQHMPAEHLGAQWLAPRIDIEGAEIDALAARRLVKFLQVWLRKYGNWKPPKKKSC